MTRGVNDTRKLEQISLRLPVSLLQELDALKEKEELDRSVIIVKALKYWTSVGGNVTTDAEYITLLQEMKNEIAELKTTLTTSIHHYENEIETQRSLLAEQQKTITTLLRMLPKKEE